MSEESVTGNPKVARLKGRGRPPRSFLVLLPHFFTTAGLFCGFYGIIKATTGDFDKAALGIVLAGFFDLFDGRVARMAHVESAFGEQYDSLADIVGFGIAPAMLAFTAGGLHDLGRVGWVCTFVYVVCAALRLARFNVSPSAYKNMFEGLPSPAAGGMIAATTWFVQFLREEKMAEFSVPAFLVALGTVFLGLLMVSSVPYRSSKEFHFKASYRTFVFFAIGFTLIMAKPAVTLFLIGVTYVSSGPVEWLWRRRYGKPLQVSEEMGAEVFDEESADEL